ncbi:hypothetical protein PsorP6_012343 [Peronosclerospora sorghi]|uniref:Uncharacterized protein n=1 Tax=Peronosclerospora sorghi TaxID=230839 RepID=A0ACC0WFC4_9STRA|nr:hypothetical protein PsorP6_012343 [Peronosclerospora sorghi]
MAARVHGQSDFSVLANPIVTVGETNRVLYDKFTSFEEDQTLFEYFLVKGVAYVIQTSRSGNGSPVKQCLNLDVVPHVNSIVAALNSAKAVSSIVAADGSKHPCPREDSFKVEVNGIQFGVCFSASSGFTMFGEDLDIKVKYLEKHVAIPELAHDESHSDCKSVASPSPVTSIGKSFLTGDPILDEERSLDGAFDLVVGGKCTCLSTPRPCIFLHGLGVLKEKKNNTNFHEYWGNISEHSPCCSSMHYAQLNTVNNSWTSHIQQQKVCDRVMAVSETSDGSTISDTIIVTHSMGGLMMAGALANKKCKLASSSTWVSTAAPMFGSMASDYFQASCKAETNVFMEKFAQSTKLCPPDDGIKSLAYMNESYSNPWLDKQFKAAQRAFRKNVYAVMCSDSFSGILSIYQAGFWILGTVVSHKSLSNDGMVEYISCAGGFPPSKFSNNYRDRFYVTQLNHHDMAFRGGDALLDSSKMPLKWFECLM